MKINKTHNQQGFTLIELLVVITIIGILATSGVGIYTTQMQGARDSVRVNNMKLIEESLHQYYSDKGAYPEKDASTATVTATTAISTTFQTAIEVYNSNFPKDPKAGLTACWIHTGTTGDTDSGKPCLAYYYEKEDDFGLPHSIFKIGTHLEKKTNIEGIARNDGGGIDGLLEQFAGNGGAGIGADDLMKIRIQ